MPYTRKGRTTLSFNYTFWLNIVFGLLTACCVWLNRNTGWISGTIRGRTMLMITQPTIMPMGGSDAKSDLLPDHHPMATRGSNRHLPHTPGPVGRRLQDYRSALQQFSVPYGRNAVLSAITLPFG